MNFVFISPHFPNHYWRFCAALRRYGVNVLGIADTSYDQLLPQLRDSLTDYYQVHSLEDGEAVLRAIGWFTHQYGKIDWLESNNEHWLAQDAWLRTMFHITTGPQMEQMEIYKRKSAMKAVYAKAGVKTAAWQLADTLENALDFVEKVGYPIIAKPDIGVGANYTFRISKEKELRDFFARLPLQPYLLEQYIKGEVCSYDALIGSQGQYLYETGNLTTVSVMDVVNEKIESIYMIVPKLAEDLLILGRKTAKAFQVKSRLIHFEFFRLQEDQPGVGSKGDLLGLEVNLRPSGGFTPDMINYAGSIDIHDLWASMICHDRVHLDPNRRTYYCVFVGLQDVHAYKHSHMELMKEWGHRIVYYDRIPEALSGAMGNQMYLAQCLNREEADAFVNYACRRKE
jgi:hypothetical protein